MAVGRGGARGGGDDGLGWAGRLFEAVPDLVCLCRQGIIETINPAGLSLLGLKTRKRAEGRPFVEFVHPDYRAGAADLLDILVEERRLRSLKLRDQRGQGIDVEILVVPAGAADGDAVVVLARDVTERRRAAEAVLRSGARYHRLVNNALHMICVCEGPKITFVNAAGVKMMGVQDASELVGRPLVQLVHRDYRELVEEGLGPLAGDGAVVPLKFVRRDRRVIDVEVNVTSFGAEGEDVHMMEVREITERLRSAGILHEREQRLRGILDTVIEGIIIINDKGIMQSLNPAAERIFGYAAAEVVGRNVSLLTSEQHQEKHDAYIRRYQRTRAPHVIGVAGREETGRRKDGSLFPLEISVTELRHGKERLYIGIVRDITERKRAEEEVRASRDLLEARVRERTRELRDEITERQRIEDSLRLAAKVIDSLAEGVIISDAEFRVTGVNPAFTTITGFSPKEILGHPAPFMTAIEAVPALSQRLRESLARKGHWKGEYWNKNKGGESYAEQLSLTSIADSDRVVVQYAAVISDVTKRKQDEERIRYQANYDALTGLPNRALFMDRLNQALATMTRVKRQLGLMFMDLDGFKLVNDTLGHEVGDLLLQEASQRLADCIRTGDTVARLGGDEFTVIMPNLSDPKNAPLLAQRILDSFSQPFRLRGNETFVSASIGITIFPDDATDATELLKNADTAMYRAKEHGKANYQFYTADLNREVRERLVLRTGLTKALDRNEFELHYQPKLDLRTGKVVAAEALMRWHTRDLGMVSPVKFIPILEESGLLVEVGEWALRTACAQHKACRRVGLPPVRIAVNLSARQLREPSFVAVIERVLEDSRIEPSGLEIEITESMLMSDVPNVVGVLERIHDMGVRVAMDDFGTGYSSLSYLKRFPIDTIKIDRSFVADITTSPDDAEIIRTIISMGQTLNRHIVAEGVETEEQLNLLRDYGCDEIQGWVFCKALPADGFQRFLGEYSLGNRENVR